MVFDYRKLKGRIIEKFDSQRNFAKEMGWSERTLSLRMTGTVPWKQADINKAVEKLSLSDMDIPVYFFTEKVQNI